MRLLNYIDLIEDKYMMAADLTPFFRNCCIIGQRTFSTYKNVQC